MLIGGDQVARASAGTADRVARSPDEDALGLVGDSRIPSIGRRSDDPDLVAFDHVPMGRGRRSECLAARCSAMTLFSWGLVPPIVVLLALM